MVPLAYDPLLPILACERALAGKVVLIFWPAPLSIVVDAGIFML